MTRPIQIPAFIQDLRRRLGIPGTLALRLDETISPVIVLDLPGERLVATRTVRPCYAFSKIAAVVGLTGRSNMNAPTAITIINHLTACRLTSGATGVWQFFTGGNVLAAGGAQTLFRDERISDGGLTLPVWRVQGDTTVGAVTNQMMEIRNLADTPLLVPMDLWFDPTSGIGSRPMWIFQSANQEVSVEWFWEEFEIRVSATG